MRAFAIRERVTQILGGEPPELGTPIDTVVAYIAQQGDRVALGHGLRYLAQVSLLVFGAGPLSITSSKLAAGDGPPRRLARRRTNRVGCGAR